MKNIVMHIKSTLEYLVSKTDEAVIKISMDTQTSSTLVVLSREWQKIMEWYAGDDKNDFIINNSKTVTRLVKSKITSMSIENPNNADVIVQNIISLFKTQLPRRINFIRITGIVTLLWAIGFAFAYYLNGDFRLDITTIKALSIATKMLFMGLLISCMVIGIRKIYKLWLNKYSVYYPDEDNFSSRRSLLPNAIISLLIIFNVSTVVCTVVQLIKAATTLG